MIAIAFLDFVCVLITLTPPVHRFAPKPVLQQGRDNGGTRIVRDGFAILLQLEPIGRVEYSQ